MANVEIRQYLDTEHNIAKAEITVRHMKNDKITETNCFLAERIKATRWKIYKDNEFIFYCKAQNIDKLTDILDRLQFSDEL